MTEEEYEKHLNDDDVIKFGQRQTEFFKHVETNTAIEFLFFHDGIEEYISGNPLKRINFKIFDFDNYQGPFPLNKVNSEQLIPNSLPCSE